MPSPKLLTILPWSYTANSWWIFCFNKKLKLVGHALLKGASTKSPAPHLHWLP